MKNSIITILFILAIPATCLAADPMREGQWELTTTMEMPGMPMEIPPNKITHCFTKEDVKDPKKTVTTDKNCTVTDLKLSGNKSTWKMKCTGENPGDFSGETVFQKDAYTSNMKMEAVGMSMNMKVKAKRLGDCPKK